MAADAIVIVDASFQRKTLVGRVLSEAGYQVTTFSSMSDLTELLKWACPQGLILGLDEEDALVDTVLLLRAIRRLAPELPLVVLMTEAQLLALSPAFLQDEALTLLDAQDELMEWMPSLLQALSAHRRSGTATQAIT